jgi:hypothetical protein
MAYLTKEAVLFGEEVLWPDVIEIPFKALAL